MLVSPNRAPIQVALNTAHGTFQYNPQSTEIHYSTGIFAKIAHLFGRNVRLDVEVTGRRRSIYVATSEARRIIAGDPARMHEGIGAQFARVLHTKQAENTAFELFQAELATNVNTAIPAQYERVSRFAQAQTQALERHAQGERFFRQGHRAQFDAFGMRRLGGDVEAARLYKLAAALGNADAQCNLGIMYQHGEGRLPQSDEKAVQLYMLAVAQGNAQAQCNLGCMYETGQGVEQSDREAVQLYMLAVAQGNAQAQCNLGRMYETGQGGLAQSDAEAVRLYRLAAAQGNAVAQANLRGLTAAGRAQAV